MRMIIGLGFTALAVGLLAFSILTSVGDNVQGALLPVGIALALLLAAVVTLRTGRRNRNRL
jgi:hypothetical protein